ncbi:MAG: hypothetical protein ACKKMV_01955 [Candidatus Nealsonbacteria bacterium]|nr:MAG: hypothetical protein IB617_03605 [Candidatus Nealsonbacteria bacterium]
MIVYKQDRKLKKVKYSLIREERNYLGILIYIFGLMSLCYGLEIYSANLFLTIVLGILGIGLILTGCALNKERDFILGFFLVCGLIISAMYSLLLFKLL